MNYELQLKMLPTAIFSVLILDKAISFRKWIALLVLIFGTALSQSNLDFAQINVKPLGMILYHFSTMLAKSLLVCVLILAFELYLQPVIFPEIAHPNY